MATQGGTGGGFGGGFGAFPYRSPHQQGGGGRNSGRGGGNRRGRGQAARSRSAATKRAYEIEILVPVDRRVRLIGRAGSVIKDLRDSTSTIIDVPAKQNNNPRHPVRIKGERIGNVLHACWKVSHLVLDDENESIGCSANLRIQESASYSGIIRRRPKEAFMVEENEGLSVFFLECFTLTEENVHVIVDNERFIDPHVQANCDIVQLVKSDSGIKADSKAVKLGLIIYGYPTQKPQQLFASLEKADLAGLQQN